MTIYVEREPEVSLDHEAKLIWQYATMERLKIKGFSPGDLQTGQIHFADPALVVGSVNTIETVLRQRSLAIPSPIYYPPCLDAWLHREVMLTNARQARTMIAQGSSLFVKSHQWKQMTGKVFSIPGELNELASLDDETSCWISDPVQWLSEYRIYVYQHKILAIACYAGDDTITLDHNVLNQAVRSMANAGWHDTYAMDWGVIKTRVGEHLTALVEVNDAWAIGAYHGIDYRQYYQFLKRRWDQLMQPEALPRTTL